MCLSSEEYPGFCQQRRVHGRRGCGGGAEAGDHVITGRGKT